MSVGAVVERAWEALNDNLAPFLLGGVVIVAVSAVFHVLAAAFLPISLLSMPVTWLLSGGLTLMANKALAGERVDLPDMFRVFERPVPYLVVGLAQLSGVVLCGVGVLVTSVLFAFSMALVARGGEAVPALVRSKDLVVDNFGELLLLFVAIVGLCIMGALACGVGLVVALPLATLIVVAALDELDRGAPILS